MPDALIRVAWPDQRVTIYFFSLEKKFVLVEQQSAVSNITSLFSTVHLLKYVFYWILLVCTEVQTQKSWIGRLWLSSQFLTLNTLHVCRFSSISDDSGIFSRLQSIYWQFLWLVFALFPLWLSLQNTNLVEFAKYQIPAEKLWWISLL